MHVAICGPASLQMLASYVHNGDQLPVGYACPLISYLVMEYLRQGHIVSVVTHSTDVEQVQVFTGPKCSIVIIPRRKNVRRLIGSFYRTEVKLMAEALRKQAPQVIHAMWTYEFADAALSTRIPTLVTCHDAPWRVAWTTFQAYRFLRALYASCWVLPQTRHLTAVSPHIAKTLRRYHGWHKPIRVIPNGISTDRLNPRLRCSMGGYKVVQVSEWGTLKNVKASLLAFPLIRARCPQAEYILFGRELGRGEAAERWCKERKMDLRGIVFRGYQSQDTIIEVLRNEAAVFLHTSREESFGMTVLDAMAQGVPCVGGRTSGAVPWLLNEGQAGLLVDIESPDQIAEGVVQLLQNDTLRRQFSEKGHQRVQSIFQLNRVVDQYVTGLESMIEKPGKALCK